MIPFAISIDYGIAIAAFVTRSFVPCLYMVMDGGSGLQQKWITFYE